jgi:histidinol dehydrogenase
MTCLVAVQGRLGDLTESERALLLERAPAAGGSVARRTAEIVARVRREGDEALRALAEELDGVSLPVLEVPRSQWERALATIPRPLREALERAAANIRAVHQALRPATTRVVTRDGVIVIRRPDPLERVGVYAPGGRAGYPSSLLMGAVPARVAGVAEVIVCSPPAEPSGLPAPAVLAAAAIAGADRLFALGGAGAVAAMAYGTKTVPRVDRIVGPGNAWVAEAKIQVARDVGIDSPAGPSELLVLADGTADPAAVAAELAAQAEHDPEACVALVSTDPALVEAVAVELACRADASPRAPIIREALAARAGLLVAASLDEALAFTAAYAAEHVLVACREPRSVAARVRNAGTVFIGQTSSVTFGDYLTGANHVLPTGGAARRFSGLSTADFVRWTTTQEVPRLAAAGLAPLAAILAEAEGLPAHAAAALAWENRP